MPINEKTAKTKYKIIKHTEYENRGNAPVYIDTSEVIRDTVKHRTVMRIKMYNNSSRIIKSVYLNAGCFDKNLNLCVQFKNIPYINTDVNGYSSFGDGQLVEVPDLTRSVFVEVSKILFDDSSMWVNEKQELAENIISGNTKNDERLRTTKAILEKQFGQAAKKTSKRLSFGKRMLVKAAFVAAICLIFAGAIGVRKHLLDRQDCYKTAMNFYINQDFKNAVPAFEMLNDKYTYFGNDKNEINYSAGISNMHCGNYSKALDGFIKCRNYKSSNENIRNILRAYSGLIAAGTNHSAVVNKDGTVSSFGDNSYKQCETAEWLGISSVSASGNHTVGVTAEGKMFGTGDNEYGQCDVSEWTDVVMSATGKEHTAALKTNNRVIARGNNKYGQCNVQDWEDIVWISASANHTVGLRSDGTVVATGWNNCGQCDVSDWKDIALVVTGEKNTVGIKNDGTVIAVGDNSRGQCDTSGINDIIFAAVGNEYIVYVDSNGKTASKGLNDKNQGSVSLWNDIAAVACGTSHTIGLEKGGTVHAIGDERDEKLKVGNIKNIGAINIPIIE